LWQQFSYFGKLSVAKELSVNRVFAAAALVNGAALFGLWMFGNWIIKADELSSLNRWLICILVSGLIPGIAALWFLFKGQKGPALFAVCMPVPLWMIITIGLIMLDLAGFKF
jgi:hypothetical protein